MSIAKAGISALLLIVLGTQFVVGFTYHAGTRWPFISYPMYSGAKYDGDRLNDFTVRVFLDDSESYEIVSSEDMGLGYWIFRKNIILPIRKEDELNRKNLNIKFCPKYPGAKNIKVELYDIGAFISKSGLYFDEPKFVARKEINCR